MPVYTLKCPDCGNVFRGMVMQGTKAPEIWVCSACKGEKAAIVPELPVETHPFEHAEHGGGCLCCGR